MQLEIHSHAIEYVDPDGKALARVTFPDRADGTVDIDHTFVDESLRGQGVAGMLMRAVAEELRETGRRAHLSCSYAKSWFEKHPQELDLVVE